MSITKLDRNDYVRISLIFEYYALAIVKQCPMSNSSTDFYYFSATSEES